LKFKLGLNAVAAQEEATYLMNCERGVLRNCRTLENMNAFRRRDRYSFSSLLEDHWLGESRHQR